MVLDLVLIYDNFDSLPTENGRSVIQLHFKFQSGGGSTKYLLDRAHKLRKELISIPWNGRKVEKS